MTRDEVCAVIEGRAGGRDIPVPLIYDMWINPQVFGERREPVEALLAKYPGAVDRIGLRGPGMFEGPEDAPGYRWSPSDRSAELEGRALDAQTVIRDWEEDGEEFFAHFPDAEYAGIIPPVTTPPERYRLGVWWFWLFERHWSLRGMENALTDFYLYPEYVHRLYSRLTDFYERILERMQQQDRFDGFFISDDIGTQTAPFFSLRIFREFFKPYYKRLIDRAHQLNMHLWLHTCGNVELFLPDLIEIGLDVIHPIQKYTMDEAKIAREYGDRICILAGFDVQQTIPHGTAEDVRREVRWLMDTFARRDGRFMLTMGNGSTPDWRVDALEALYDESTRYVPDTGR